MALIDSSMYLQQQAPDIAGGIAQGMKLKDMMRQQKLAGQSDANRRLMSQSYTPDPVTGKLVFNPSGDASKQILENGGGQDLYKAQQQQATDTHALKLQQHQEHMNYAEEAAPVVLMIKDADTFAQAQQRLRASKNPMADELGAAYDPKTIQGLQAQATPIAQHFAQKKEREAQDAEMLAKGYARDPASPSGWSQVAGGAAEQAKNKNAAEIKHLEAEATKEKAQAAHAGDYRAVTQEGAMTRQENTIHDRVVARVAKDPILRQRITQFSNLDNAYTNFVNAEHPTVQQFNEFQQAVKSNTGIKGANSVHERDDTMIKSFGMDVRNAAQYWTGVPQDLPPDAPLLKHMQNLARLEQANIKKQSDKHLRSAMGGHASMYEKRKDLKADLEDLGSRYRDELSGGAASGGQPGAPPGGGVQMRAPDGRVHLVSPDQVEAAKAAGGQPL